MLIESKSFLLWDVSVLAIVEARELDVGSTGQGWKTRVELSWIGRAMVKEDLRNKTKTRGITSDRRGRVSALQCAATQCV